MATSAVSEELVQTKVPRAVALALATLAQSSATLAQQGVVVVGVFFVAVYHLTLAQMGLVVSFVSMGWMASGFFTGLLLDRFGARIVLFCGTLLMSVASVTISQIHNLVAVCVLLFVMGLGISTVSLGGTFTTLKLWPRTERGLPMGIRQMGVPVGSMTAAFLLPTIAALSGLHTLFWIFAALLLAFGMTFCWVLPAGPPAIRRVAQPMHGLRQDLRHILEPCFAGFLLAWGQYVLLTFTIPMLHGRGGLSVVLAGVVLAVAQIGGGIARISLGAISDRLHSRRDLVLVATAGVGTALALLTGLLPTHLPLFFWIVLWLFLGMAMVGWNALIITWTGERVRPANAGAAMGLTTTCILFGAVISAPIIGLVIQHTGSYSSAWFALTAILGVATLVLWRGARRETLALSELPDVAMLAD